MAWKQPKKDVHDFTGQFRIATNEKSGSSAPTKAVKVSKETGPESQKSNEMKGGTDASGKIGGTTAKGKLGTVKGFRNDAVPPAKRERPKNGDMKSPVIMKDVESE